MYEIKSKKAKGALFLVIGIVAAIVSFNLYSDAAESEGWPSVKCEIIDTSINRDHSVQTGKSKWKAEVKYRYEVKDQIYENDNISFGVKLSYDSYQLAQKSISSYPLGGKVLVYYDPNNPQFSTLEVGVGFMTYLGFAFSAVAIIVGLVFLL